MNTSNVTNTKGAIILANNNVSGHFNTWQNSMYQILFVLYLTIICSVQSVNGQTPGFFRSDSKYHNQYADTIITSDHNADSIIGVDNKNIESVIVGFSPAEEVLCSDVPSDLSYLALILLVVPIAYLFIIGSFDNDNKDYLSLARVKKSYIIQHIYLLVIGCLLYYYFYYSFDIVHWTNAPEDIGWFWTIVNFLIWSSIYSVILFSNVFHYMFVTGEDSVVASNYKKYLNRPYHLVPLCRASSIYIIGWSTVVFIIMIACNSSYVRPIWWFLVIAYSVAEIVFGIISYSKAKELHSRLEVLIGIIAGLVWPIGYLITSLYWASLVGTSIRYLIV